MSKAVAPGEAKLQPEQPDELLLCLQIVARAHGEAASRDALMSGLPAEGARLSPALFARAAKRAHLSSRVVRCALDSLNTSLFPVILLLDNEHACVLLSLSDDSSQAQVVYPELADAPVWRPLDELARDYSGDAIYARPMLRYDARTPTVRPGRHDHWFWGVIAESRPIYQDVLLAAFLANLFALGMPLFTMNVYDRVVPNQAIETLWVLASGLVLMMVSDLVLRTMRGRFVDLASSRADVKLSAFIMERVLGMRMEQRPTSAGSFASNLRSFESVRDFIGSATVVAFIDLPFSVIFVVAIGWISWLMLVPLFVGGAVMVLYALAVQGRMHELAETTYRAGAQRNATLIEGLVGFETIKAIAAEAPIQRKWEKSAALLARVGAQLRLLSTTASNTSAFVQQFINLVIVVMGVYLIYERRTHHGWTDRLHHAGRACNGASQPGGRVAGAVPHCGNCADVPQ
jgi:ATP-binding cassette subfamily C protein LapB